MKKIHTLTTLLDYAIEHFPQLEKFRDLYERVTDYYFIERYPKLTAPELSTEDIKQDLDDAKSFIRAMFPEEEL